MLCYISEVAIKPSIRSTYLVSCYDALCLGIYGVPLFRILTATAAPLSKPNHETHPASIPSNNRHGPSFAPTPRRLGASRDVAGPDVTAEMLTAVLLNRFPYIRSHQQPTL